MKKIRQRSDCPISLALEIFGDKWTLLIIRDLIFTGKKTYGEFLNSGEKIATNILADRLSMLEHAGLITSKIDNTKKSSYIYSLTDKGIDLVPVIFEIVKWSVSYYPNTAAPEEMVERIKNNKEEFVKQLTGLLKQNR